MSFGLELYNSLGIKSLALDDRVFKQLVTLSFVPTMANYPGLAATANPEGGAPPVYSGLTFSRDTSYDIWSSGEGLLVQCARRYELDVSAYMTSTTNIFGVVENFTTVYSGFATGVTAVPYSNPFSTKNKAFCVPSGNLLYIYLEYYGIKANTLYVKHTVTAADTLTITLYEY